MGRETEKIKRIPGFVDKLKELMGDMDNTAFAKHVGLSRQTLGYYLNGNRLPDAVNLRKICTACNVSADYLLGLSDIASVDADLRQACEYTGLSEDAVTKLHDSDGPFDALFDPSSIISQIIENRHMPDFLQLLAFAKAYYEFGNDNLSFPPEFFSSGDRDTIHSLAEKYHGVFIRGREMTDFYGYRAKEYASGIVDDIIRLPF